MSVLKSKRKTSRMEFLHNAYVIQRQLVLLMLRDFGLKAKVRSVKLFSKMYKMTEEDMEALSILMERYGITSITEEYPEWMISDMRNRILYETRSLIRNLIQANSIYPTSESEFTDRRRYQTMAVGNCEQIIQELQYVISIVDVDANKYMPFVDMVDKEIALIKGWRKSDNRLLTKIREKDRERAAEENIAIEKLTKEMKKNNRKKAKTESEEQKETKEDKATSDNKNDASTNEGSISKVDADVILEKERTTKD